MPERSLVLFDIDGTLLRSEGAGIAAMLSAFRQIHGDLGFSFDGLEIAGALDGLLFAKLMSRHGLPAHAEAEEHFRNTYRAELDRTMTAERTRRMPGAAELAHCARNRSRTPHGKLRGDRAHQDSSCWI